MGVVQDYYSPITYHNIHWCTYLHPTTCSSCLLLYVIYTRVVPVMEQSYAVVVLINTIKIHTQTSLFSVVCCVFGNFLLLSAKDCNKFTVFSVLQRSCVFKEPWSFEAMPISLLI